jgi:hypothetical protein
MKTNPVSLLSQSETMIQLPLAPQISVMEHGNFCDGAEQCLGRNMYLHTDGAQSAL